MSITHFPDLTELVHAPRAFSIKFPLGRTFGQPGRSDLQENIVRDMLDGLSTLSLEEVRKLPYRWKRD
ncbi:hypothetical protein C6I21_04255 [Alkalicoccus urumqiensis]|uniref:Uncharacterized protein n=2 Tax=Alkalicoccus urumqiensis TaxID=1548213 RepID=A0A2P6MJY0_ALKUR|nr:hypothetical protein [Alkalicoccus urumqiensis]PRO66563.1 hypothetical protein C6I21_04255 [Alkalicoccus urumqiensis]